MKWWCGLVVMWLLACAQMAHGACASCSSNPGAPAPLSGGLALELVDRCQCDPQVQLNNNTTKLHAWAAQGGFDPTTTTDLREEFVGGDVAASGFGEIGELGWSQTSEGAACGTISQDTQTAGRWGLVKVMSGANMNADACILVLGNTTSIPSIGGLDTSSTWTLTMAARLLDNTSVKALLGFGSAYTVFATPSNFIGVRYDTVSDTNWMCVSCVSGTCTTTSTGVAGGNTSYHRFKLQRVSCAQGDCLRCTVDTAAAVDVAADMPSATVRAMAGAATRTTAGRSLTMDFWRYLETGLSR